MSKINVKKLELRTTIMLPLRKWKLKTEEKHSIEQGLTMKTFNRKIWKSNVLTLCFFSFFSVYFLFDFPTQSITPSAYPIKCPLSSRYCTVLHMKFSWANRLDVFVLLFCFNQQHLWGVDIDFGPALFKLSPSQENSLPTMCLVLLQILLFYF